MFKEILDLSWVWSPDAVQVFYTQLHRKAFSGNRCTLFKTNVLFLKKLGTNRIFKNWIIFQMPWGGSYHRELCHECFWKWRIKFMNWTSTSNLYSCIDFLVLFCNYVLALCGLSWTTLWKKPFFLFEYLTLRYFLFFPRSVTFNTFWD